MTLDEFRRHPAYDYYIRTLVSNCLICELDNKFDYKYKNIVYIKPNFEMLIIIFNGKNVLV